MFLLLSRKVLYWKRYFLWLILNLGKNLTSILLVEGERKHIFMWQEIGSLFWVCWETFFCIFSEVPAFVKIQDKTNKHSGEIKHRQTCSELILNSKMPLVEPFLLLCSIEYIGPFKSISPCCVNSNTNPMQLTWA